MPFLTLDWLIEKGALATNSDWLRKINMFRQVRSILFLIGLKVSPYLIANWFKLNPSLSFFSDWFVDIIKQR